MGSEVDCSGSSRAVWLVKVPKYLSNIWMENTDASGIVGSLQITNNPQRNEVAFNLSDELANKEDKDSIKIPRGYKMVLSKVEQSMGVFSERPAASVDDDEEKASKSRVTIEGVVVQKADCRPVQPTADYLKLKKRIIVNTSKSGRQAKMVDRVIKYRPVSDHKMNAYLKGILKEIGYYNTKNPHKNMWELKPEYRHYSSKNSGEEGNEGTSS
ncbi:General transcription factor IIF subunit 2 [Desmophyllum pertusum]|uniref:General transcription factor IIF subunit 2 n=1 Tax=Desmophyllum pertusum TaxID=174260 RepID=A0A9W9Z9N3_9CNID|nr:General transcription factor IIF subunit 2 [Desmophyllum pertusum]